MGEFITAALARERISAALDAIDAAHSVLFGTSSDEVGTAFRVEMAERVETQKRVNRGLMYRVFGQLADPPDEVSSAPGWVQNVAARLWVRPGEVKRIKVATRILARVTGYLDPEARAYVEAATAAVRPDRHVPDGTVEEQRDDRSPAQRCHDGIKLGLKAGTASGALGSHRGHPVTVIARTTLTELNQAAHAVNHPEVLMPSPARTGAHSVLPMRDRIRMAADAIHDLAVFDDRSDRPLYRGRQKRVATADQRIICSSRDGGCTRPNVRHEALVDRVEVRDLHRGSVAAGLRS